MTRTASRSACRVAAHDFTYLGAFPHEADMDQLAGVDFDKGCYVGQEVVSRVEHRSTARSASCRSTFDGRRADAGRTGRDGRHSRSASWDRARRVADWPCCGSTASPMHWLIRRR